MEGVGKSAITNRYIRGDFLKEYLPTLEDIYCKDVFDNGEVLQLQIVDTAGSEDFTELRDAILGVGDGFMLVFSITNYSSLDALQEIRDDILQVHKNKKVPFLLVGNKSDSGVSRQVAREEAIRLANQFQCKYIETSARNDININEIFSEIFRSVVAQRIRFGSSSVTSNEESHTSLATGSGEPPLSNYYNGGRGRNGGVGARRTSGSPRSPGLLDESSQNVSRASQYFNNASQMMVQDNRKRKDLEQSYKSPARVVRSVPQQKVFELDEIHLKTLQTIFTLLDSDQDNMLDVDQLRTAIIAMGIPPSQRLIQEILRNVPDFKKAGGRGQVDFHTFKTVVTDRLKCNPVYMADIDELFKVFETSDGAGFIADHHLRHLMEVKTTNNTNLTDEEVDEIFKELRIERRAEVDYREFLGKISSGFVNFE
eukprot:g1468.t1